MFGGEFEGKGQEFLRNFPKFAGTFNQSSHAVFSRIHANQIFCYFRNFPKKIENDLMYEGGFLKKNDEKSDSLRVEGNSYLNDEKTGRGFKMLLQSINFG